MNEIKNKFMYRDKLTKVIKIYIGGSKGQSWHLENYIIELRDTFGKNFHKAGEQ